MEEQAQDTVQEEAQPTGMLGGTTESDFVNPSEEQDTSVDVFETETTEAPKVQRPEDLPEQFWDEDNGTFKANEIYEEYKTSQKRILDLRQKISKGQPVAPDSADGYQLDADKLAEAGMTISNDDPAIKIFREAAAKAGISVDQFQTLVSDYTKGLQDSEEIQKLSESKGPSEEDQQAYLDSEMKKLGDNAQGQIQGIKNWFQQLHYDGVLSRDDLETAQNMGMSAKEIKVLGLLRQSAGNLSIPETSTPIDGAPSEQEIQKMISSPEYRSDPVLQKKVTDYYQQKFS